MNAIAAQLSIFGGAEPVKSIHIDDARRMLQQHRRSKPIVNAPTLPGDFTPPPPECPVSKGGHLMRAMSSYSDEPRSMRESAEGATAKRWWPEQAYKPFCVWCARVSA